MRSWRNFLRRLLRRDAGLGYWEERARTYGARSVLNLAHPPEDIDALTARQISILMPKLRAQLDGSERLAVDYGCGTGRFSGPLAEAIRGRVIAVDPIQSLLDLAPPHDGVRYRLLTGPIPAEDESVDVVWICLVLGSVIDDRALGGAVAEISRVLKAGGLLFIAENTSEEPDRRHVKFRSDAQYRALFPAIDLDAVGGYEDAGERISILAGRKRVNEAELRTPLDDLVVGRL